MTATLTLGQLLFLACLACLVGFLFGVLAVWRPGEEPHEQLQARRCDYEAGKTAGMALPRAGRLALEPAETWEWEPDPFPTVPQALWTPHAAQLARTEAEIRQMIRDYGG